MNYRRSFIQNGLVFITIVTNNRIPILIDNINLLKQAYKNVRKYYNFKLIAHSIQPDHLHCIIKPAQINNYPKIIKSFKYSITKLINVGFVNPTYNKIWQNRYWEHAISPSPGPILIKESLNTLFFSIDLFCQAMPDLLVSPL